MNATLTREIETDDEYLEVAISVVFDLVGGSRPATRTDPEESPEIEVKSATRSDTGEEVELTDDEKGELWKKAEAYRKSAAEDAAVARWEARRDARNSL